MTTSLPRNWQYSQYHPGDGTVASITLPAIPSVSHVLTAVDLHLVQYSGAQWVPLLQVSIPGTFLFQSLAFLQATAGSVVDLDSTPTITTPPNLPLAVALNAATPAGIYATLTIQGYDF